MSLPSSANPATPAAPTQKPGTNIYTVMLILAFLALVTATIILAVELSRFGPGVPWAVPAG